MPRMRKPMTGRRRSKPRPPAAAGMAGTAQPSTTTPRSGMATQTGGESDVRKKPWKKRRRRSLSDIASRYNFTRNIGL